MSTSNIDIKTAATEVLPSRLVKFVYSGQLSANTGMILNFRSNESIVNFLAASYESAAIESVEVTVQVAASNAGQVGVGFGPSNRSLSNLGRVMAQEHSQMAFASQDTAPLRVDLPTNHLFGRELLGVVVGNQTPVLSVQSAGFPQAIPVAAFVKVILVVRGSGYPANPVQIALNA